MKGKAVQVDHYLFDQLWNRGNKRIPDFLMTVDEEVSGKSPVAETSESKPEASNDTNSQDEEETKDAKPDTSIKAAGVYTQAEADGEEEQTVPASEMDPRIIEAFNRCLLESV
jgi:hypothetical protein